MSFGAWPTRSNGFTAAPDAEPASNGAAAAAVSPPNASRGGVRVESTPSPPAKRAAAAVASGGITAEIDLTGSDDHRPLKRLRKLDPASTKAGGGDTKSTTAEAGTGPVLRPPAPPSSSAPATPPLTGRKSSGLQSISSPPSDAGVIVIPATPSPARPAAATAPTDLLRRQSSDELLARQLQAEADDGGGDAHDSSPAEQKRIFKRLRRITSGQSPAPTPLERELSSLRGGEMDEDVEAGMIGGLTEAGVRTRHTKGMAVTPGQLVSIVESEEKFMKASIRKINLQNAAAAGIVKPTRVDKLSTEQRSKRLDILMEQTNKYLAELDTAIRQRATAPANVQSTAAAAADTSSASSSAAAASAAAGGDNHAFSWMKESMSFAEREYGSVEQPSLLSGGVLKDYQLTGLRWLLSLHRLKINGILADEMGLGKTIQTVALLVHLFQAAAKAVRQTALAQCFSAHSPHASVWQNQPFGPHLIVVPLSTIGDWVNSFSKWCPSGSIIVEQHNSNTVETDKGATRAFTPLERQEWLKGLARDTRLARKQRTSPPFHVMLTTYELAIRDEFELSKFKWQYLVVDEAHRLKNSQSRLVSALEAMQSEYRLLLTGTPLQNNLSELFSLLNFILPTIFADSTDFLSWFASPFGSLPSLSPLPDATAGTTTTLSAAAKEKMAEKEIDAVLTPEEKQAVVGRLHAVLRPFVLRRMKADVLKRLPKKEEVVVRVKLSGMQTAMYHLIQSRGKASAGTGIGSGASAAATVKVKGLNNILMQLRKVCLHPDLFMDDTVTSTSLDESFDLHSDAGVMNLVRLLSCSGKFLYLHRLLPKLLLFNHRILIFSQMTRVIDIIQLYLNAVGIANLRLDGSTKASDRGDLMAEFNETKTPVFLLSTRAGGVGLNLQSADTVILFDSDLNPQQDLQAQARAHRIGQTRDVRVIRLVVASSVEERILSRAQQKLALESTIIGAGKFDNKTYTAAERKEFLLAVLELDQSTAAAAAKPKSTAAATATATATAAAKPTPSASSSASAATADADAAIDLTAAPPRVIDPTEFDACADSEANTLIARSAIELAVFDQIDSELRALYATRNGPDATPSSNADAVAADGGDVALIWDRAVATKHRLFEERAALKSTKNDASSAAAAAAGSSSSAAAAAADPKHHLDSKHSHRNGAAASRSNAAAADDANGDTDDSADAEPVESYARLWSVNVGLILNEHLPPWWIDDTPAAETLSVARAAIVTEDDDADDSDMPSTVKTRSRRNRSAPAPSDDGMNDSSDPTSTTATGAAKSKRTPPPPPPPPAIVKARGGRGGLQSVVPDSSGAIALKKRPDKFQRNPKPAPSPSPPAAAATPPASKTTPKAKAKPKPKPKSGGRSRAAAATDNGDGDSDDDIEEAEDQTCVCSLCNETCPDDEQLQIHMLTTCKVYLATQT